MTGFNSLEEGDLDLKTEQIILSRELDEKTENQQKQTVEFIPH